MNAHRYQLIGSSECMKQLRAKVYQLGRTDDTVLIFGERGTGKELVARTLHLEGRRRGANMVLVDCSTLSQSVVESDLFGHERGAFTGAHHQKMGLLEDAQGGMVFFDEIAHLSLALQAKLLRFLEEKTLRRVGGRVQLEIDARIVVATNRDLSVMAEQGEFLPDLYDRLNVLRIETPPLREHPEDMAELVEHFFRQRNSAYKYSCLLSPQRLALLQSLPWKGNVRELFNVLRRLEQGADPDQVLNRLEMQVASAG